MNTVKIADRTITEAGMSGAAILSFKEKIEVARHLDNLNVDVIELPAIENARTDSLMTRTISSFVKNSIISVPVGISVDSVEIAWKSVSGAKHPRLRVELPVSPVQMEYVIHKKAPKMIELVAELVGKAASLCEDVEFCAVDATRAEQDVLKAAVEAAVNAGAKTVTLCDNAATMMPDSFSAYVSDIRNAIPALQGVKLGVLCENKFGMALATAILAAKCGADEIKTSVTKYNAPSLEALAEIVRDCGDKEGITTRLKFTELHRITKQIKWIAGKKHSGTTSFDATSVSDTADDTLILSPDDDINAVISAVEKLGYDLPEDDKPKVYEEFKRVASKKKITSKELDAIVASTALQVPPTYKLISYVINSGNVITSSAHIKLEKDGRQIEGICLGDGPIDAAFLAIEQIVGHHYELDDFQIQAVTEGHEAMGSTLVRLRNNGKVYAGNGISTDIVGASIRAYVSALNKIAYEEA
ncbi:MAG: hypothetical protein IKA82_00980 [Clostridia bacterium]|nr:hypothetical protein [Clostridia bacterium]